MSSSIQTLVGELKQKLSYQAIKDLDRLIQTPEAKNILQREEDENLARRRVLEANLNNLSSKYDKQKEKSTKESLAAAERVLALERDLTAAKKDSFIKNMIVMAFDGAENTERFTIERQLREGADPRITIFKMHVNNNFQFVNHGIAIWVTNERDWFGKKTVSYFTNEEIVLKTMGLLRDVSQECSEMQLLALSYADVTKKLNTLTEKMRAPLNDFKLLPPFIDETGEVKYEDFGNRTSVEKIDAAIFTSRNVALRTTA